MKRLVLKRLSASDLTIFEYQFRNTSGTKQKGINLDKSVFLGELYPNLRSRLATAHDKVSLELQIYGPGNTGLYSQQRKILLQTKNIRLNGEFVQNPIDDKERFNKLEKGDLALIEFVGDDAPSIAKMFLISNNVASDVLLYKALMDSFGNRFSNRKAMAVLRETELPSIIEPLELATSHPILDFIDGQALEDAAQGDIDSVRKLQKRRQSRGVSIDELQRAKNSAERNGRLGEELLNAWLDDQVNDNKIADFIWDADINAISPYDFTLLDGNGRVLRKIDAKSTSGEFKNKIHISLAELYEIVHGEEPYDLYRLYNIGENQAYFRIAENVKLKLKECLEVLESLQDGIRVDGISIDPSILSFGDEVIIDLS